MAREGQPGAPGGRPPGPRPATGEVTVRRAIIIGTLFALLVGGVSSLATAQLAGQPPDQSADLNRLNAEIDALKAAASAAEVAAASLEARASAAELEAANLGVRASAAEEQVATLESENASLQEQLSQLVNPPSGPSPTADLTVNWMRNLTPSSEEVVVCVTIENTSDNGASLFYSEFQFSALDAGSFVYPPVVNPSFLSVPLMSGELRPGESRRGELPYVISPQAQPLVRLVWHTGYEETPEIALDLPKAGVYDNDDLC
jgi:uncharacterized protein DUF4352